VHVHKVFTTLLGHPTGLFEKSLAERLHALSPIITGIVKGRELLVDGFIEFDPAGFNIFFQKLMNGYDSNFIEYFGVPHLQTKPGREISVASFGQE
jgi:hypothetical protein